MRQAGSSVAGELGKAQQGVPVNILQVGDVVVAEEVQKDRLDVIVESSRMKLEENGLEKQLPVI